MKAANKIPLSTFKLVELFVVKLILMVVVAVVVVAVVVVVVVVVVAFVVVGRNTGQTVRIFPV